MKITEKKLILAVAVFLAFITASRLLWMKYLSTWDYPDPPTAADGVLDLRHVEWNSHQTLELNGEWRFYPGTFLMAENGAQIDVSAARETTMRVPKTWDNEDVPGDSTFRYGSYRLQILLNPNHSKTLGLRLSRAGNASAVYINGQLAKSSGHPSTNAGRHRGADLPYTITIPPGSDKLDVVIHVSSDTGNGGISKPVRFGTLEAVRQRENLLVGLQLLMCVIALFHSLYGLILYALGARRNGILYFLAIMTLLALAALTSDDKLLFHWIETSFEWQLRLVYLTYIGIVACLPLLSDSLFPSNIGGRMAKAFSISCALIALHLVLSPAAIILASARGLFLYAFFASVGISGYILISKFRRTDGMLFLIFACMAVAANMIWSLIGRDIPRIEIIWYPFDLMIAILSFSAFWFQRFFLETERPLRLAEKLRREDKRKDEFLVNTSHELRNPLQGISNILQVILDDRNEPISQTQRERIETARRVSRRMNVMLDDLIDITRLKEKTIPLELRPVHLQSVAAGVLDMIAIMLERKPIRLRVDIDKDFPRVLADENRLVQILFNLLHNAVKYTDEGFIRIQAVRQNRMAEIRVEDTGVGIAEKDLSNIFLPYEQAERHTDKNRGGFGLGLAICKQLVELHGGTIRAASRPGEGSVFSFTLPYAEESGQGQVSGSFTEDLAAHSGAFADTSAEAAISFSEGWAAHSGSLAAIYDTFAKASAELSGSLAGERPACERSLLLPETPVPAGTGENDVSAAKILLVDDDAVNLHVLAETLKPDGYEMTCVTGAEQALAETFKERYDLVIADVMMPKMSGYELTRILRDHFNMTELPVLLLTARIRTEDIVTGFLAGANDYVKKPADAWELKARVLSLLQLKTSFEERLRMESAWLQSQIRPHFLYNTLNSIAALAAIDIEKMLTLLYEFSNYLRLSFDFKNASPLVDLEHELSLVRSYIYIEQERFGDRIKVEWEVDEGISIRVPPLSIQPLVENAVKHGLMSRSRGGTVSIVIRRQEGRVDILVKDDGVGMRKEQIEQLFAAPPHSNTGTRLSNGVGLRNIERRLRQLFRSGLHIESEPDQGTIVRFSIPEKG
mgnify:FL=1|jgi:Signal transduction histidine kinase